MAISMTASTDLGRGPHRRCRGPTRSRTAWSPIGLARRVREILPTLPDVQRQVVVLRDIEGVAPADVCELLGVTAGNQRVLLHRARARIREQLEAEMGTT